MQSTGEVKFSNTSYTIHVRARSLNLSLGQIIIESIPRPCSAKISRCHIHDVTVHLRGNSALQPQTFPQHHIHGVAICACSSTAASSLHYILVVGLWQLRYSATQERAHTNIWQKEHTHIWHVLLHVFLDTDTKMYPSSTNHGISMR